MTHNELDVPIEKERRTHKQKTRDRSEYNRQWYLAHKETENAGSKKYYAENVEKCRELSREWRKSNPEGVKAQKHRHTMKYLDKSLDKIKAWVEANPERSREAERVSSRDGWYADIEKSRAYARSLTRKLKIEIIAAYGGCCKCCGEDRIEFLNIDHVNGGGTKHIKSLQKRGSSFYGWLKANGYPKDGYRILCWNCNCSRGMFGFCPHENEKEYGIGVAC